MYDVVIAGGSITGLLCAREIASEGRNVLVLEEDFEIGTPEHCGGLVSTSALEELGIIPTRKTFENQIEKAEIFSPNGKSILINSSKQKVMCVNRRELDKQVAHQAQKKGADIQVQTSYKGQSDGGVETSEGHIDCKIVVDCRGVTPLINKNREGALLSAQYEIYADWIEKEKVEVYFDQEKYPGFFSWVIPSANGTGKVGVAGKGINASSKLEEFLSTKGKHSKIRKIFAPIWINGPIEKFISGNLVIVGDAAGQSKPTTAGGIYSCGMAGIYSGRAITKFLNSGNVNDLNDYQKKWTDKFGKEFEKQLLVRKILGRIENKTIDKLFNSVTPGIIKEIADTEDFDFHTGSIVKLLGLRGSINAAQTILSGEIKKLLS